jgi:hypothetical protein
VGTVVRLQSFCCSALAFLKSVLSALCAGNILNAGILQLQGISADMVTKLVREVLHSCQAINPEEVDLSHVKGKTFVVGYGVSAMAERQLMLKFAELGWLVRYSSCHNNISN